MLRGEQSQLQPAGNPQLVEDRTEMVLHGLIADLQSFGDVFVAITR